ncbi:MAG: efflux RND transporter permease subunit [Acidobacteriota bacterium]
MIKPPTLRPVARTVLALGLLLLGTASALQVPIDYLPVWTFPELDVALHLPETDDVDALTRGWVVPLESAIRAIGGVRDMAGEVHGRGAELKVRLAPGSDAERKAARLESELQSLRSRLPGGAGLRVTPAGQGDDDPSMIVWLPESASANVVAETLRADAAVRAVLVAGERRREIRVTALDASIDADELARSFDAAGGRKPVGTIALGSGWAPVLAGFPEDLPLAERSVRHADGVVRLGAVARVETRRDEPSWLSRVDGQPGTVLLVIRELDASPLDLSRGVRTLLRDQDGVRILIDQADPLRRLILGLLGGLASASLVLAVVSLTAVGLGGDRRQRALRTVVGRAALQAGLPWLALAGVLVVAHAVGLPFDVTTMPSMVLGVGAALLLQAVRGRSVSPLVWITMAGVLPSLAVVLISGPAGALLAPPVRAFALAVPSACLASLLIPVSAPVLQRRPLRWSRAVLRHAGAVLLFATVLAYGLVVVFGDALRPKPGRLASPDADLFVQLRFAEGATVESASREIARVERHLSSVEEVEAHWSVFQRRWGQVGLQVRDAERSLVRLRTFASRLETQLAGIGASVQVRPLAGFGGGEPLRFRTGLGDEPELSENKVDYRFVVRSADLANLQRALDRLDESLQRVHLWQYRRAWVVRDWGAPATRLELRSRLDAEREQVTRAAAALAERASWSAPRLLGASLPGDPRELVARVVPAHAPGKPEAVPTRVDLLGLLATADGAVSPRSLFAIHESFGPPTVKRQSGRFVLPVTVRLLGLPRGQLLYALNSLQATLGRTPLPAGVELEQPRLDETFWDEERIRLVAIAAALPLLFVALLVCRSDSLLYGLVGFVAPVLAVVVAAPAARASGGVDELGLLAVAVALAAVVPFAGEVVAAIRQRRPSPLASDRAHRWLGRHIVPALAATVGFLALALVPGWGLAIDRHAWVAAMRLAGVVGASGVLASIVVLPSAVRAMDRWRFRDVDAARRRAVPPVWHTEGEVALAVRSLGKVYGPRHTGFTALRSVDFELKPGITGLLGPNGAGKTTLLRLLCGLLEPTRGQVVYRGVPVVPDNLPLYRRLVGFLPQSFNAYEGFTVEAFLDYWAIERGIADPRDRRREIEAVLDQVALLDAASRKVRDLSGGMRRRIGIARSLLGAPPILIVDEPTTGLDVESRNRLREALLRVASERIVLFSTHIASDVAAAASRILLLDQGRLLFDGSSSQLIAEADGRVFETLVTDEALRSFSARYRVTTRVRTLGGLRVRAVANLGEAPPGTIVRPNLEEAYLAKLGLGPQGEGERRTESLLDLDLWRT